MPSNLTNVYAHLRRTFLDVDMLFAKPVSYIKPLVDSEKAEEKVIFVFIEVSKEQAKNNP